MTRQVTVLMLAVAIVGVNAMLTSPLASAVGAGLGVSPQRALGGAASYGLATMISALVLAPLADRLGLDRALAAALAVLGAGFALAALADDMTGYHAGQILAGTGSGVALPATYALAAAAAPPGAAARTMGRVLFGWTIALVAGVSLAALLADLLGWRVVYAGFAGLALALAALVTLTPFTAPRTIHRQALWRVLALPGLRRALGVMLVLMLAFYLCYTMTGPLMTGTLGQSTSVAGLLPLAYGLGFGASLVLDPLVDRLGPARVAPPLLAVTAAVYVGLAAGSGQVTPLLAISFVWGMTQHLCLNLAVGRLASLAPERRGAVLGLNTAVTYLAVFGGAMIGRPLFAAQGFAAVALVAALLLAGLAIEARSLRR